MASKSILAALAIFASIPVFADTIPCSRGNLASYTALTSGCMEGIFTFKNFAWNSSGGDSFVQVSPEQVFVTPVVNNTTFGVNFTSSAFSIGAGQRIAASLDYTVDPPPEILDFFSLDLFTQTPVAPGNAIIQTFICAGDLFSHDCANGSTRFLEVQHLGGAFGNVLSSSVTFSRTNLIDVRTIILLDGGPSGAGGSSSIAGFGQATVATVTTPEPASFLLGGLGLGLLALVKRRRG